MPFSWRRQNEENEITNKTFDCQSAFVVVRKICFGTLCFVTRKLFYGRDFMFTGASRNMLFTQEKFKRFKDFFYLSRLVTWQWNVSVVERDVSLVLWEMKNVWKEFKVYVWGVTPCDIIWYDQFQTVEFKIWNCNIIICNNQQNKTNCCLSTST